MQINNNLINNYYPPSRGSNNAGNSSSNIGNKFADLISSAQNSTPNNQVLPDNAVRVIIPTEGTVYSGGGRGGSKLTFELRYAENSTEENPIMTARGWDENDNRFEQTININDIDPRNATLVEIKALQAHLNGGKLFGGVYPDISPVYSGDEDNQSDFEGLNDRTDYISILEKNISIYNGFPKHLFTLDSGLQEALLGYSQNLDKFLEFEKEKEAKNANQ